MIPGQNAEIEAARCVQEIGRNAAYGGPVVQNFQTCIDGTEHKRMKNIIKASPLEAVHYMNDVFVARYQENCKHVKPIVEACVKEYAAEAKAINVDMPNELRRMEGDLKRMEDNVNQFKQEIAERSSNLPEFGVKVVSVETLGSADYN